MIIAKPFQRFTRMNMGKNHSSWKAFILTVIGFDPGRKLCASLERVPQRQHFPLSQTLFWESEGVRANPENASLTQRFGEKV